MATAPTSDAFKTLLDFVARYDTNVELFVREALGFPNEQERAEGRDIHPWQLEAMRQYDARFPRISVRSGNGVGKTTLLDWLMWHHLLCQFPQKTAVTAPTEKQLFDALWAEFGSWGNRLPKTIRSLVEIKSDRAELIPRPDDSFISIKTARVEQPEALQGVYSPGKVLLIGDEGSGIPDPVFQAAQGSMAGGNVVMIVTGNPLRDQGFFYDIHQHLADSWWTRCVPVSAENEPRKGAAAAFAKQIADTWGEHSNEYRTRVLGEFPISDDNAIIPRDLIEAALTRDITLPMTAPIVWGVDVARQGADRSALAKRQQQILLEPIRTWHKLDTMAVAGWIKLEWDQSPGNQRPVAICVDAIGWGAGVADRLHQLGIPARAINVSESPAFDDGTYADLRTELWFKMRGWFAKRDCKIPTAYQATRNEDDLVSELSGVHYGYRKPSLKLATETKDITKKRLRRSPDLADALMMTFAVDALTLAGASRTTSGPLPWRNKGLV
jgi:phage terminase large subunit